MTNRIFAKDFARAMSKTSDKMYTIYECQDFLTLFQKTIEGLMLTDTQITLLGFGSFTPKYSKPRVIKSGLTGKGYEVPAGMTMKFVVSPAFQEELKRKFKEGNKDDCDSFAYGPGLLK